MKMSTLLVFGSAALFHSDTDDTVSPVVPMTQGAALCERKDVRYKRRMRYGHGDEFAPQTPEMEDMS